jgi:hypothetical protein
MIEALMTHFERIRTKSHDDKMRMAFSVGIYATIVVQAYQYFKEAHAIVGGAYPTHFIDVTDKTKDDVIEMLDNCIHAKYGALPAVVKVTVLTFQRSPSSMCHYLVLTGHPQINETSGYCAEIFVVCKEAAHRDWNDVVLNADKCGVLCEIDSNKSINVRFLD